MENLKEKKIIFILLLIFCSLASMLAMLRTLGIEWTIKTQIKIIVNPKLLPIGTLFFLPHSDPKTYRGKELKSQLSHFMPFQFTILISAQDLNTEDGDLIPQETLVIT